MAQQIKFFKKNRADFEYTAVTATASEGQDTAANVMNRSNRSAWTTSGSADASGTTFEVNFGEVRRLTDILLLKMNWKSYTGQYWNEDTSAWAAFPTAVSETTNSAASKHHTFAAVNTSKIKFTINGTIVADAEKYLYQLVATEEIGQLNGWPVVKNPRVGRELKQTKMLSGKVNIVEAVGFFTVKLSVANWSDGDDLDLVETLYDMSEGFLVWLCGGDEDQFSSRRQGYRMEDIFLMRCANEYRPEFVRGFYKSGLKLDIDFVEVVT